MHCERGSEKKLMPRVQTNEPLPLCNALRSFNRACSHRKVIFWSVFSLWLSDLHIAPIVVLNGANPVQFENEPAALALSLATKARQIKAPVSRSGSLCARRAACIWYFHQIGTQKGDCIVVNRLRVMAPKPPRKQRPADCDANRSPVLFSCPSAGKSHCALIISKRFACYPFHLSFELARQIRRNMPLTKESDNKERHKQRYPNFHNKVKWDSFSKTPDAQGKEPWHVL